MILNEFFFGSGEMSQPGNSCLIKWKEVCRPKHSDGLGVTSMDEFIYFLSVKWWWKHFGPTPAYGWKY